VDVPEVAKTLLPKEFHSNQGQKNGEFFDLKARKRVLFYDLAQSLITEGHQQYTPKVVAGVQHW